MITMLPMSWSKRSFSGYVNDVEVRATPYWHLRLTGAVCVCVKFDASRQARQVSLNG